MTKVRVVGAGLAGSEAINYLAKKGIEVEVYEVKRQSLLSGFHSTDFGELVCSNSLKSTKITNACGLLKAEIEVLGSLIIESAYINRIPSGQDLAVDRQNFSAYITKTLLSYPNVTFIDREYDHLIEDGIPTIIATGPLSTGNLLNDLSSYLGEGMLSFYDAAAPLVFASSLDMNKLFLRSRYDEGSGKYLNSSLDENQFNAFYEALIKAKRVLKSDAHFEGCLPIEVLADRGKKTLKSGPLKTSGLIDEGEELPAAIVQMRQDDVASALYGLVGFQTNLTYEEQKRVFGLIPGLENAKYARFGLMHKNSFICSPSVLTKKLNLKKNKDIYIAGQLNGVEGYVESAAMGLLSAIYVEQSIREKVVVEVPLCTMIGSLVNYIIMSGKKNFAPMNATYGIAITKGRSTAEEYYQESIKALKIWQSQL